MESISEIMKYHAIGNLFSICNEVEYYFDEYVTETDTDGNETDREPTENEKLERILESFKNGQALYATFRLDCGEVVPCKNTTMQSDFFVNQDVYVMYKDKILKTKIASIFLLNESKNPKVRRQEVGYHFRIVERGEIDTDTTITESFIVTRGHFSNREGKEEYFPYGNTLIYTLDNVFSNKEDLVKHLMEGES